MKESFHYHRRCNYCNSTTRKLLFTIGKQKLYQCKCSLVYFDKQRKDLKNLYNEEYYVAGEGNATANYADYQVQENTILKDFSFAFDFIAKAKTKKRNLLLEIGPGYGYFLKHLPANMHFEGVEVSHDAVLHMRQAGITIYEDDFLHIKLSRKYDFIVAFDVVEHQIFLKQFFEKVHTHLKKGGFFLFTTPDYGSMLNKIFKNNAPTIQPLYHNYYLTQTWLTQSLPQLGFKIVRLKTIHLTYISIGQIVLMGSFAFPFIRKLGLFKIVRFFRLQDVLVPFFRFGGIECIVQKI